MYRKIGFFSVLRYFGFFGPESAERIQIIQGRGREFTASRHAALTYPAQICSSPEDLSYLFLSVFTLKMISPGNTMSSWALATLSM